MTKRDFFRIIIKLFGLYSLILSVFNYIPSSFSSLIATNFELSFLLLFLGAISLTILIYTFLILKTDTIIRWLKIDSGFDDDNIMLGNFNEAAIIKLALILFGGLLIVNYSPDFLYYCYLALKKEAAPNGLSGVIDSFYNQQIVDYFKWVISGVNIIVGYLLLTNYSRVTNWLSQKRKYEN